MAEFDPNTFDLSGLGEPEVNSGFDPNTFDLSGLEEGTPEEQVFSENGRWAIEDGDTVTDTQSGETIRLSGIDTSETAHDQPGKRESELGSYTAKQRLKELIDAGGDISVERIGSDTYGRTLGKLRDPSGLDLGEQLVRENRAGVEGAGNEYLDASFQAQKDLANLDISKPGVAELIEQSRDISETSDIQAYVKLEEWQQRDEANKWVPGSTLGKAVQRGTDNTQGLLYAAVNAFGEFTGLDSIAQWGEEGVLRNMQEAALNPAEIGDADNIQSLADVGTYIVEAIGEQLPNLALSATGAGAGAVAIRAAIGKSLLKKAGARFAGLQPVGGAAEVMQGIISKEANAQLSKSIVAKYAAGIGAGISTYPLGVGEVQQELKEGGIDSPGTALLAGLPIAALDAASFDILFGNLFRGVSREVAEDLVSGTASALGFVLKEGGKGMLKGGLTEVPTEVMQEMITITARAYHDPTYEIFSDENIHRLRETALKAGIVGAAGGGFSASVQAIREMPIDVSAIEEADIPPPTSPPPVQDVQERSDVIEVPSIDSIPVDHITEFDDPTGGIRAINTREYIKSTFDEPINNYTQLLKCMGG